MKLTPDQVRHVARLARLALTDGEVEQYRAQLSAILDHIDQLNRLDTREVEPTAHASDIANTLRPDMVVPSLPAEKAVANAPTKTETAVTVPRILD
jgi:aspartyl-tRNA(Asn)/glutamyl-tRNA(Gln) amidotransferase subunit C